MYSQQYHNPPLHPRMGTLSPSDADEVEQCFAEARQFEAPRRDHRQLGTRATPISQDGEGDDTTSDIDAMISPPPRRPSWGSQLTPSTAPATAPPLRTATVELHLPAVGTWSINRGLWYSPWRYHLLIMMLLGALVVACWERQVFESVANSEADPPLVVAALVLGKAWCCALILLVTHALSRSLGTAPERFLYKRWLVFWIACMSFSATVIGAYALSVLSWSTAVILNPLAFAPLFFLIFSRLVGSWKRLPRGAMLIVCIALISMSAGLIRGIANHSLTSEDDKTLGEGAGCLLSLVSGALLGASLALGERYAMQYPTSPLYLTCVVSFLEVAMLPTVMLVDMTPLIGSSATPAAAVGRFFSLHRNTIPSSMISMVGAHAAVYAVVFPLLIRAPSLMVPLFSFGPLLASSVYPGPTLPVLLGGAYGILVMILLLVSEAEYDEESVAAFQARAKVRRTGGYLWQHGASIICWRPPPAAVEPRDLWRKAFLVVPSVSWWARACLEWCCIVGWMPLHAAFPMDVKYSGALVKATRRDRYGYTVVRLTGLNVDD
jgi:hypothetical protein